MTRPDRIAITTHAVDLLTAPPLNRIVRADHDDASGRQQDQQQAEQNPARLPSAPTRPMEHPMVILKRFLFAQANDAQTGCDGALATRQQSAQQQDLGVLPNGLGKERLKRYDVRQVVWAASSWSSLLPELTRPAVTFSKSKDQNWTKSSMKRLITKP